METNPPKEQPLSTVVIVVLALSVVAIPLILVVTAKIIEHHFKK